MTGVQEQRNHLRRRRAEDHALILKAEMAEIQRNALAFTLGSVGRVLSENFSGCPSPCLHTPTCDEIVRLTGEIAGALVKVSR